MDGEVFEKLAGEMRRGTVILAALSQLSEEQYGYSLISSLEEQGFVIGQDTLYPLLRRLEEQGVLESEWRVADEARPRRYYILSDEGKKLYSLLKKEWEELDSILRRLME